MPRTPSSAPLRNHLAVGAVGLCLGATIALLGFVDYGELNEMFTFRDLRMLLAFGGAVGVAAVGFRLLAARGVSVARQPTPRHRGLVPGGVLFGTGWALTGGCPGIVLVQLGFGYVPALCTLAGIMAGMTLFNRLNARVLRIDSGSCGL